MKPVAWTTMPDANDWDFISGDKDPNGHMKGTWHPLYSADQLRELEQQRDELLAAAKKLDSALRELPRGHHSVSAIQNWLLDCEIPVLEFRKVIAKVKP